MPTKPKIQTLSASSADVLNAIRTNASAQYQAVVPFATTDLGSLKAIGSVLNTYPVLMNEFLSSLVNRIGYVMMSSKNYSNPWSMFKKGRLELGETIEEIFVALAKPFEYDPAVAETEVEKRVAPDVMAAYHIINYRKFYKVTVQEEELTLAFTSSDGVLSLVSRIVDSLYSAAAYDEFLTMKYLIARSIVDGKFKAVKIPEVTAENMKQIASIIKGVSNSFTFMGSDYNYAGVETYTEKGEQYLIRNTSFDATMDVEVLASAFNMSKAEFEGHGVLVDDFGEVNEKRLEMLFKDDPNYTALTPEELTALKDVPAILVDRAWFMIFDKLDKFTQRENEQGIYRNHWYHVWKVFSASPFANAVVFVKEESAASSITITPASATVDKGQSISFTADVTTTGFASKAVQWSIDSTKSSISNTGVLKVAKDEDKETITVTAKSVATPTITKTAEVTVNTGA